MAFVSLFYIIFLLIILGVIARICISQLCSGTQNEFVAVSDRLNTTVTRGHETDRDHPYNDIFFIEPNEREAARIRAQLAKDARNLPSYDEVMRITNLSTTTTTAAAAAGAATAAANTANSLAPAIPSGSSNISTTVQTYSEAGANVRPLTPPPYTPAPMGATLILPITTPLHVPQQTQSS